MYVVLAIVWKQGVVAYIALEYIYGFTNLLYLLAARGLHKSVDAFFFSDASSLH